MDDAYALFRRELLTAGVYRRDYLYYGLYAWCALCGVLLSVFLMTYTDNLMLQALNGAFLAFVLVQMGMLGHDLSHGQVFTSARLNRTGALFVWGLFGGLSASKWFLKHSAHHAHTNELGRDPDLDIPFVFSAVQHTEVSPVRRLLLRYQHVLFFLALPLLYVDQVRHAVLHTVGLASLRGAAELALIIAHFILLVGLPLWFLPLDAALVLLTVHFLVVGLYMSLVFAPNHKGKAILASHEYGTWREQIILTRNIRSTWYVFQLFGGLNFQIEHHLFPEAARTTYRHVQARVQTFCEREGVPYDEVSWHESLRAIYRELRRHAEAGK